MAIQKILIWPDNRLLQVSKPVEDNDDVEQLITDMFDTMKAYNGLGLAAIQIGIPKRVIVFNKGKDILSAINPEITKKSDLQDFNGEGCLSLPGEVFNTERYNFISLRYYPEPNTGFEITLNGLEAIEVQHEMDHLDGKLLVTHPKIGPMRRDIIRRRMIKYKRALNGN